jgi:glycosyltransferase involved in cell wall biosynthesis
MSNAASKPLLSVIIPVYNEEKTIHLIVDRVLGTDWPLEIIVVDDHSTDRTPEILTELAQKHRNVLRVLRHERNLGKGAGIRTALASVTGEVVIIQDADFEYHPEDYPVALRLIHNGWADAVYGSRFLGPHRVFLYWHYLANKLLTFAVNILTDSILTDMETGFKMFRTDLLRSLDIESFKFDFEVEVTMKLFLRRYRVCEIPITYTGRDYNEGKKITWRDGVHALWAIFKWGVLRRSSKRTI